MAQLEYIYTSKLSADELLLLTHAIGRIVLSKLPGWVSTRRKYAQMLTEQFNLLLGLRVTIPPEYIDHAYYKYYVFVRPEELRAEWTRDRIIEEIKAEGIQCFSGSGSEIYLEKAFPSEWRPQNGHAVARELGETSLMFLVHPTLTEENIQTTYEVVKKIMLTCIIRERVSDVLFARSGGSFPG